MDPGYKKSVLTRFTLRRLRQCTPPPIRLPAQQKSDVPIATWNILFNVMYLYRVPITQKGEETAMRRPQSVTT